MGEDWTQPTSVRKRGRRALPAEEVKRHAVGIRTTRKLKGLLQRAADSSGRSVAQEIEFRLEQSFALETLIGSQEGLWPAVAFGLAGQQFAEVSGLPIADWRQDRHCYENAMLALVEVLWRQHPNPGERPWRARRYWLQRLVGRLAASYGRTLSDEDLTIRPSAVDLHAPVEG
jgi:hypothetical protein